jgi:hypothetical protein
MIEEFAVSYVVARRPVAQNLIIHSFYRCEWFRIFFSKLSVELCVNNDLNEVYQIILSVEDLSFIRKKMLSFMGFPWGTICPFSNMDLNRSILNSKVI